MTSWLLVLIWLACAFTILLLTRSGHRHQWGPRHIASWKHTGFGVTVQVPRAYCTECRKPSAAMLGHGWVEVPYPSTWGSLSAQQ